MRTSVAIGLCAGLSVVFACALVVPRPEPERATPRPEIPPEELSPPSDAPCIRRAPPLPPDVDWIAAGCPTRFGGCLSGPDAAKVAAYVRASRAWMAEAARRCDGR